MAANGFSQQSRANALIQLTLEAILNKDIQRIDGLLRLLPLDKISRKKADDVLRGFLEVSATVSGFEIVPVIFKAWERVHPPEEKLTLYETMYYDLIFQTDVLRFCAEALPLVTYTEVASHLIVDGRDNDEVMMALRRLDKVYGKQTSGTVERLHQLARDAGNTGAENYYSYEMRTSADYINIPDYVRTFIDEDGVDRIDEEWFGIEVTPETALPSEADLGLPEAPAVTFQVPPLNVIVDKLVAGMKSESYTDEQIQKARDLWRAQLTTATLAQKIELIRPVMEVEARGNLQYDLTLFRMLGPANPLLQPDEEQIQFGGARMFTDLTWEYDEEEMRTEDWFVGACMYCSGRIRRRWHAVRIPKHDGGWQGCFCTFKCARDAMRDRMSEGDEIMPDLLTDALMLFYERALKENGIQDRLSEAEFVERAQELEEELLSLVPPAAKQAAVDKIVASVAKNE